MKDRQRFQIIEGFSQSSGKLRRQHVTAGQEIPHDTVRSVPFLLQEQVGSSLTAALKASEQRLSALLHDRSRIGRELHDSVLQALYAIELGLVYSRDQAAGQVNRLIQDIRRMILGVESDNIQPFSLAAELRFLAQTLERMGQLRIHLEVDSSAEEILTGEEARELITIAREALNNCVRHAQATRIEIALRHYGSRVRLRIRDNGLGFDVVQGLAKGLGFAHMQDRVRRIGGHLDIESTIGGGSCITAEGPQIEDIDMMGLVADGAKRPGNNPRLLEP